MAFKTIKGVYADRPLLTEQQLDFILQATENYPVFNDKYALIKDECVGKLFKSKCRINMLKLNK